MCICAPTLIVARNEYTLFAPGRDKSSDGCCPSAAHTAQNPKSDHEPGKTGVAKGKARAYDFDEDWTTTGRGPSPLMPLVAHLLRDERTKYVIYEGILYYPDGTTRKNKGHEGHLHLSIHEWAVDDKRPWNIAQAFEEEDEMNEQDRQVLNDIARNVASIRAETDKLYTGETPDKIAQAVVKALPAGSTDVAAISAAIRTELQKLVLKAG